MAPRVGIVGTMDRLSYLIPLLHSLHIPVTALWCRNHDDCRRLATKHGVALATRHFQELLVHPDVDLVYVATDPVLRAEVSVKAVTSGKHCVSLSPMAVSCSDGEKMLGVSLYYPQLLSLVQCHLRHLPATLKLREMAGAGFCGRVLVMEAKVAMGSLIRDESYSWRCDSSVGGGALSIVGSHLVDLLTFTTGSRVHRVQGSLKTFRPKTPAIHGFRRVSSDDYCSFQAELANGVFATVTINTHAHESFDFEFSVTGTSGRLVLRGMDLYGLKIGSGQTAESLLHKQDKVEIPNDVLNLKRCPDYYQSQIIGSRELFRALKEELEHTHQTQATRRERLRDVLVSADFQDGLHVRNVLDAVAKSSGCGQWVEVKKVAVVETSNPFWTSSDARFNDSLSPTKKQRPSLV